MNLENIIRARDKILKESIAYFKSDPATKGIFLAGSLATNESDAYSDIDLRVVVKDDEINRAVEDRLEVPKRWGELLFNQWLPHTPLCFTF